VVASGAKVPNQYALYEAAWPKEPISILGMPSMQRIFRYDQPDLGIVIHETEMYFTIASAGPGQAAPLVRNHSVV